MPQLLHCHAWNHTKQHNSKDQKQTAHSKMVPKSNIAPSSVQKSKLSIRCITSLPKIAFTRHIIPRKPTKSWSWLSATVYSTHPILHRENSDDVQNPWKMM
mmetsp:Transcript_73472/g.129474  ORF Transcript_73472/g.129474 Transcript_73472/m.129474 type:complete len:101 (-) Transcript_73472:477-779(-)